MKKISLAVLGLVAGAAVSSASAADLASPGVYFGSGNTNGNFTVTTANNIEIGQRAIIRYGAQIVPQGNIYVAPQGATSEPGKAGSVWGFTFSVNTDADGAGGLAAVTGTTAYLTLTDTRTGATTPGQGFNLGSIPDNTPSPTGNGFQNSEALSFTGLPDFATLLGDPGYDLNAAAVYLFTITVRDALGGALATNSIEVDVPEPLTLSLFAVGLVGAGALRRRKKVQA